MIQAEVEADWDEDHQVLQIKEIAAPRSRLVLGDRGDDGDVFLGIGRVKKGQRAATPSGGTSDCDEHEEEAKGSCGKTECQASEDDKLSLREVATHILNDHVDVHDSEHAVGGQVLA